MNAMKPFKITSNNSFTDKKLIENKYRWINIAIYLLFSSGIVLWEDINLAWEITRLVMPVHIILSVLALFWLFPFLYEHIRKTFHSREKNRIITGYFFLFNFVLIIISGFYLFFIGNLGNRLDQVMFYSHLLPSFLLILGLLYHYKKAYSRDSKVVLNDRFKKTSVLSYGLILLLLLIPVIGYSSDESTSLYLSRDKQFLYSANYDVGSISKVNRKSGALEKELALGKDIRRIAFTDDERLCLASDYLGNHLFLIDADSFEIKKKVPAPLKPFGIVYDKDNQLFWVSLFESFEIIGVRKDGKIVVRQKTEDTPRGLTLTRNGRLLVSHSLTGKVSIYQPEADSLKLIRLISLHETQDEDEKLSQGKPRLLDDIAITPDGSKAWLPHLLWNFDHPFQFQSTIFPTVSIIDLTPGKEEELKDLRKHLFKQINILDSLKNTRIISNPHDLEFSEDGGRAYVTLSGSEDLMVFDLSRTGKKNEGRHRRLKKRGGAKVVQVLRHLPGKNPRGLIVDGEELIVQNAMSLDLSVVNTGGKGAFSRAKVDKVLFGEMVKIDPVSQKLREGKQIFHTGNTDRYPEFPITGDFWMSCQSCHFDGFNFTNRYLLKDMKLDRFNNAVTGHEKLKTMLAGDFVGDYIRIIQNTQGGMGGDPRAEEIKKVNPDNPSQKVIEMMESLHEYVTRPENLRFFTTWMRIDDNSSTSLHKAEWINSASCGECHSEIFRQWSDSNHRLMSSNPYYLILEDLAAQVEGEEFRTWCMGCHNPQGLSIGERKTTPGKLLYEKGGESLKEAFVQKRPVVEEGTGCLLCHRITKLEGAGGNADYTVNLKDRTTYPFENSQNGTLRWFGHRMINARPSVHKASYINPLYKTSSYCGSCHSEFAPGTGSMIVETFEEWRSSPYNDPDNPEQHKTCIDCHMHKDINRIGEDIPGTSTDGGTLKSNVATHHFTGANHFLVGLRSSQHEQMSVDLLKNAVTMELDVRDNQLIVEVKNIGAGHALPTGVADFRELWLEVTVKDVSGKTVLQSGYLKPDGNVPEDARIFQKVFGDFEGKPVGALFWRYAKLLKDTKIPAGEKRDEEFELPDNIQFPVDVEVRLLFRVFPQWFTDIVKKEFAALPDPPVIQLHKIIKRF